MKPVWRSTWARALIVLVPALMLVQCGGDDSSSKDKDGAKCSVKDLTAGNYAFTLPDSGIGDDCDPQGISGLLRLFGYIQPGPYSIHLPSYQQLLAGPVQLTATLPFVGAQTGTLTLAGNAIGLTLQNPVTVQGIDIEPIGLVDITVSVVGTFCPVSTTHVDVEIVSTITNVTPAILAPCAMTFRATGTR
jgi:hypothetical protein